jgi:hypothetical protein
MVVELFRSERDRYILHQNGFELEMGGAVLTICRPEPQVPRMLVVESPASLMSRKQPIPIEHAGTTSNWTLIEIQDRTWLSPERGSPFPPNQQLALMEREGGRLVFEPLECL